MIATLWLLSLSTTILFSSIECTYEPNSISDNQLSDSLTEMQDNYLTEKRTKPSLSIINPLDVLRQRLLLELARRQVRENTKQIEHNRAILKNVGKRVNQVYRFDYEKQDNDKRNAQSHDDDLKIKYLYSLQ